MGDRVERALTSLSSASYSLSSAPRRCRDRAARGRPRRARADRGRRPLPRRSRRGCGRSSSAATRLSASVVRITGRAAPTASDASSARSIADAPGLARVGGACGSGLRRREGRTADPRASARACRAVPSEQSLAKTIASNTAGVRGAGRLLCSPAPRGRREVRSPRSWRESRRPREGLCAAVAAEPRRIRIHVWRSAPIVPEIACLRVSRSAGSRRRRATSRRNGRIAGAVGARSAARPFQKPLGQPRRPRADSSFRPSSGRARDRRPAASEAATRSAIRSTSAGSR